MAKKRSTAAQRKKNIARQASYKRTQRNKAKANRTSSRNSGRAGGGYGRGRQKK